MKLTKYWNAHSGIAGIKTDNYSSRLSAILTLAKIAREQFPQLSDEDLTIVCFHGDRWAGQFGIEFKVGKEECPQGYMEVSRLEPSSGN